MKKLLLFTIIVLSVTIVNAQWQQPSFVSANSQNIYAITSDGTNIFAGTGSAGISLSTNNANSWTLVNNSLTGTDIGALAINGTNVFAGGDGVFLSTNNGTLWTAANTGFTGQIQALAISETKIFAGTGNYGVYLSNNDGGLWTSVNK